MLQCTYTNRNAERRFVLSYEIGNITKNIHAHYCKLDFNVADYDDALFDFYSIKMPRHIKGAVKKRRAEYLAGRLSCKYVLEELKLPSEVLSKYPDRQPYWPQGVCGSISHHGRTAIAAVIREELGWIGIDIETLDSELLAESEDIYTSAQERELLKRNAHLSKNLALLVTFSAKESLFKALYPQVQSYFGFEYANVLSLQADVIKLELAYSLAPHIQRGTVFDASYMLGPDKTWVLTIIIVDC